MALEKPDTLYIPLIGSVDAPDGVTGVLVLLAGLIGGAVVWNVSDDFAEVATSWLMSKFAALTGFNPETGNSQTQGGAFD